MDRRMDGPETQCLLHLEAKKRRREASEGKTVYSEVMTNEFVSCFATLNLTVDKRMTC